jgi:hypothetical protein
LTWNLFYYLELDKEVEELKSKPVDGGTDDIIKVMRQFLFTYRKCPVIDKIFVRTVSLLQTLLLFV